MKWIIVDWTSTRCYSNKKFKSYEDAWDFLYCEYPDDDDALDEYYVIKESNPHRYLSNKCLENQKVNQIESWKI